MCTGDYPEEDKKKAVSILPVSKEYLYRVTLKIKLMKKQKEGRSLMRDHAQIFQCASFSSFSFVECLQLLHSVIKMEIHIGSFLLLIQMVNLNRINLIFIYFKLIGYMCGQSKNITADYPYLYWPELYKSNINLTVCVKQCPQ